MGAGSSKGNTSNKGSKGKIGSRVQRYGTNLAGKTPRQPASVIPEAEAAKQMVENAEGQKASNFIDSAIDRAIEEGTPEAFIQLKDISDSQFQDWQNKHPESKIDADWLKTVRDNPYRLAISQLSPYDIPLPPLPLWKFPQKLKEQPLEVQQQFFDRLNEEQITNIPYQWGDHWKSYDGWSKELLPELVVQKRKLTEYRDPNGLYDIYPGETRQEQSPLNGYTNSNALTYQGGDIHTRPVYNQKARIPYYPKTYSLKEYENRVGTPEQREAEYWKTRSQYPTPDYTNLTSSAIGPYKPVKAFIDKNRRTLAGAGALTGLGLAAYPFLSGEGEDEVPSENAYIEASQTQAEPTLEQRYASQPIPKTDSDIWGEKLNKLAHLNLKNFIPYSAIVPLSPFLNKEAFHQPQTVSSNFNDLVKSIYGETPAVPSELPASIPQDNFVAPKELPAEGQTLDDYNRGNQPQEGVVLASQDTGPRVLNAPTEKKAVRKATMPVSNKPVVVKPVQSEDRLTEANLASAMINKAVSPQVLQYGSPYYLQENKPVDMRQWVRQKYGMSMSPAEMVQRGIMPYEYLQYW